MVYYEKKRRRGKSRNYFVINKRLSIKASPARGARWQNKKKTTKENIQKSGHKVIDCLNLQYLISFRERRYQKKGGTQVCHLLKTNK